jgi:hypothetical protein
VKIMTSCAVSAIALLAVVAGAYAAEADTANVTRVYNDIVAPADQQAYETGVKNYNKCLDQHGFKYAWGAWAHETGNTYKYSYVAGPFTWATFDAMHTAGKACDDTWKTGANPHLKGETSAFLVVMPELSYLSKDKNTKPALIGVTNFTLKTGHEASEAFTDAVKKITAAAEKSKWSQHYMVEKVRAGDDEAPDFILVSEAKNWADFGAEANPSLWKMVENAYGKQDTDALRKTLNDAIHKVSSHVDSYNADLTYTPSGK